MSSFLHRHGQTTLFSTENFSGATILPYTNIDKQHRSLSHADTVQGQRYFFTLTWTDNTASYHRYKTGATVLPYTDMDRQHRFLSQT